MDDDGSPEAEAIHEAAVERVQETAEAVSQKAETQPDAIVEHAQVEPARVEAAPPAPSEPAPVPPAAPGHADHDPQ